jgi:probable rRNA maturation factor
MSKTTSLIRFHYLSPLALPNRKKLKRFIVSIFKKEGRTPEKIDIVFCSDNYLLDLNRRFLQHDFYTDILSFTLSEPPEHLTAEIYISIDRVRENVRNIKTSFKEEIHRVIFHGVLHFCGFKDKSPADIKKMRAMEDKWLNSYFRQRN